VSDQEERDKEIRDLVDEEFEHMKGNEADFNYEIIAENMAIQKVSEILKENLKKSMGHSVNKSIITAK
jgi:type I site-specific restriction endonuclease